MTTTKMQGLDDYLRAQASVLDMQGMYSAAETLRQWAAEVDAASVPASAAEAVPVAAWLKFDGMKAMPAYEKAAYARQKDWLSKEIVSEYSIPLYRQPPAPKEVGISASEAAPSVQPEPVPWSDMAWRPEPIGFAPVTAIDRHCATMEIGPHLPGVRDVAMFTKDQVQYAVTMERAAPAQVAGPPVKLSSLRGFAPGAKMFEDAPPNANCPVKCESMAQCSGACDFMEAAPQPAVVEALPDMQKIESDALSNARLLHHGKIAQAYRLNHAQGKTEEDFDRLAWQEIAESVRYAVRLTAREVRSPVWPYALAASAEPKDQDVREALTPEQISAVYLLLVHRKRPEFGWMEVALLGAEKVLEPLHSAIHDAQFDAMDAAFRGGV